MTEPARTPSNEDSTRAQAEPIKTGQMEFDLEARIIVESWVLSPSSARNIRKNAVIMDFHMQSNLLKKLLTVIFNYIHREIKYSFVSRETNL
jgi:ribosome-associated toxin RatA of RatAB toxin-antitoxin module